MIDRIKSIVSRLILVEAKITITVILFALVSVAAVLLLVYGSPEKKDLRASLPANSIAYLQTADVGRVIEALNKNAGSPEKRDLSVLKGFRIGVAITGFKAKEQEIDNLASVLSLTPTFGAVVDSGLWSWQVKKLVDGPVSAYVKSQYDGIKRTTEGGWTVWAIEDGRKLFAYVDGSRVFFGNDKETVENCLAADRSRKPSLMEDRALETLVSKNKRSAIIGYFPKASIEKFADIAGISAAVSGSEDSGGRMLISRLVPQLLRNSVKTITWTASIENNIFQDRIEIETPQQVSSIFAETLKSRKQDSTLLLKHLPGDAKEVTHYKLQNAQVAFRSLVVVAAKNVNPVAGRLITSFSGSLLEPYGVSDPEVFLSTINSDVITFKTSDDSGGVIVSVDDQAKALSVLIPGFKRLAASPSEQSSLRLVNQDAGLSAFLHGDVLVLGDSEAFKRNLGSTPGITDSDAFRQMIESSALASTVAVDNSDYSFLRQTGLGKNTKMNDSYFLLETDFRKDRLVRTYFSKFGFAGSLISNFTE
jgi:hypothetical protein